MRWVVLYIVGSAPLQTVRLFGNVHTKTGGGGTIRTTYLHKNMALQAPTPTYLHRKVALRRLRLPTNNCAVGTVEHVLTRDKRPKKNHKRLPTNVVPNGALLSAVLTNPYYIAVYMTGHIMATLTYLQTQNDATQTKQNNHKMR